MTHTLCTRYYMYKIAFMSNNMTTFEYCNEKNVLYNKMKYFSINNNGGHK